jgi:hypothetical protein
MSRSRIARRAAVLATTTSIAAAAFVAAAGPATAVPFEGDPAPGECVRLVPLPGFERSADVFSPGLVAVLVPRAEC